MKSAQVLLSLAAAAGLATGCDDQAARTTDGGARKPAFSITSTLDGKRALPHRVLWVAKPSLPADEVKRVEFRVDDKVAWVEREAPYTYSEGKGYLVTSWIKPGMRSFTVRARAADGRTASDTVRARVVRAPAPPPSLAGRWKRRIDTTDAPEPGTKDNPTGTFTPSGSYTLVFDRRQAQTRFPGKFKRPESDDTGAGWILDADYSAAGHTLEARGAVTARPFANQAEGGWWCEPDGPASQYDWSVGGGTLTLKARGGKDACGIRGFIWAGRWHRP